MLLCGMAGQESKVCGVVKSGEASSERSGDTTRS
jgi:hypothetical protein